MSMLVSTISAAASAISKIIEKEESVLAASLVDMEAIESGNLQETQVYLSEDEPVEQPTQQQVLPPAPKKSSSPQLVVPTPPTPQKDTSVQKEKPTKKRNKKGRSSLATVWFLFYSSFFLFIHF
jgi:hypothetical protein